MKKTFQETQKFTQWWVWLIILGILIIPIYTFLYDEFSEGLKTLPVVLVVVLFYFLKLTTKINEKSIQMSFFPFVKKTINWNEIKKVKVFDYGFVGGWGIRLWTRYGTVYNIRGSKGLLIELNSGKSFVIGTQNEAELKHVLEKLGKISEQ